MNDKTKIINFCNALITVARRGPDKNKWPMRACTAGDAFMDIFAQSFFDSLDTLQKKDFSFKKIAKGFKTPSRLWKMSHHLLKGLQVAKTSTQFQRKSILLLLDIINELKNRDLFNISAKNILLSNEEVHNVLATKIMHKSDDEISAKLHYLIVLLWSYTECLYFSGHSLGKEYHGAYEIDKNETSTIIRDFFNLKPVFFWKCTQKFPFYSIRIITSYKKLRCSLDVYNNLLIEHGSPRENLSSFSITANGEFLSPTMIDTVTEKIKNLINEIVCNVEKWSIRDKAIRFAEIFWLLKKPLSESLHKDWTLPFSIREKIEKYSFESISKNFFTSEHVRMKNLTSHLLEGL